MSLDSQEKVLNPSFSNMYLYFLLDDHSSIFSGYIQKILKNKKIKGNIIYMIFAVNYDKKVKGEVTI